MRCSFHDSMTQCVDMQGGHVHGYSNRLLHFAILTAISEARRFEARIHEHASLSDLIAIGRHIFRTLHSGVHPCFSADALRFHDERLPSEILMQEATEEREANSETIRPQ